VVELGRDYVYWANGLVLAAILDGGQITFRQGDISLGLLAGVTERHTVDFDSSRPGFDEHTHRAFYGAMVQGKLGRHRPFAYVLLQRDLDSDSSSLEIKGGAPPINTRYEYNSNYFGIGSTGTVTDRLTYQAEFVAETGGSNSNSFQQTNDGITGIDQSHDRIEAYACDVRLDYLPGDTHATRFSGEILVASGDDDRGNTDTTFNGNQPHTADHAFNAFGAVNTGLAFNPQASNLAVLRIGASAIPFPEVKLLRRLQAGADFFVYAKTNERAPIDEVTSSDRYLGVEPDVFVNWRVTSDVTIALRYGIFFPSGAIQQSDDPRQFLFAGVTLAF
jgi:hypothetical protein